MFISRNLAHSEIIVTLLVWFFSIFFWMLGVLIDRRSSCLASFIFMLCLGFNLHAFLLFILPYYFCSTLERGVVQESFSNFIELTLFCIVFRNMEIFFVRIPNCFTFISPSFSWTFSFLYLHCPWWARFWIYS